MSQQNPILQELTGLASGVIVGTMIIIVGRYLFTSQIVPVAATGWVQANYDPASITVILTSTFFATIWYLVSLRWWTKFSPVQSNSARFIWFLLFAPPVISVLMSFIIWGKDGGNNLEIFASFIFLIALSLGMLSSYWIATAFSTPDRMRHVVPLISLLPR